MNTFARFEPRLQQAIVARLGFESLRPVQEQAGDALLAGENAVVLAPTAGGKTEAAVFPLLSSLLEAPVSGVGVLYVAPIKALLNNQAERLGLYTEMVGLRSFVWHGDTPQNQRRRFLREPSELLLTTPESLEVMLVSSRVDEAALFGDLRALIVDEVHALAGSDRGAHLLSVTERIARLSSHDVQRVGLSATVGNPEEILGWLSGTSRRAGRVVDPKAPPARRQLKVVQRPELAALAHDASRLAQGKKSLFFCQSRSTTEAVAEHMRRAGTTVFVHHSAVSKEERELAEERFHRGTDACIVCTSTLELGIDVGDLDLVLQAEAPDTVSAFLQRMGRTGRRPGKVANTTFFCETGDSVLQAAALIELAKAHWIEPVEMPSRCWPALLHQLLAMSLAGGVTPDDAWRHISSVPDFADIHHGEFERLLSWLLRTQALLLTSGRLALGPRAERRFGRRHFMELYAVFESPKTYSVQTTAGQPLGTLNQAFVDRLVEGVSSFLLGGRAWAVLKVQHEDRRVIVAPAPRGRQPTWGGFVPQFLGLELCQQIRHILVGEQSLPYFDSAAGEWLAERRREVRDVLSSGPYPLEQHLGEIRWWTFAGGRINATLRYALGSIGREALGTDLKVVPDNFSLKIRGKHVDRPRVESVLDSLADHKLWENDHLWHQVAAALPNYRLSKFQPLMPPWIEREILASYMLDVAGAWRWLSSDRDDESQLARVPGAIRAPTLDDKRLLEKIGELPPVRPALARERGVPLVWVATAAELEKAVEALSDEPLVGLDVETTIGAHTLCLIQIAGRHNTYLIDALEVPDLGPLDPLFSSPGTVKVIHHASFERRVLGRYGFELHGVIDTEKESQRLRGRKIEGKHSLKAVCARELDVHLDKGEQRSDWSRRPLSEEQIIYAALDAEILLVLHDHFERADTDNRLPF